MATIKDIARLAKVSTATVSNVLNGKPGAAGAKKKQEILDIARNLHYTPNSFAQRLKKKKTNTIGIITEDLTVFNTPEIVDGIDVFCEQEGFEIILGNLRLFKRFSNDFINPSKYQQLLDDIVLNMLSKQVEGIVYIGYHCREILSLPSRVNVPMTYAYCYPKGGDYPSVIFDDEKAAFEVTNLLISKGHTNIGVLTGPPDSLHTTARLKGFQKALFNNGILYNAENVYTGDWERPSGYNSAEAFLSADVSAIFAFNDMMASGIYEYCTEKGLVMGKDISLFGFDNREISHGYSPRISTVEVPLNKIGQKSAELVLQQISSQKRIKGQFLLECDIHPRGSIGNIIPK